MGRLIIDGTLDLRQFWPTGESDADTAKVVVNVTPGAVKYQPSGGVPNGTTKYDGAYVKSFGKPKPVIKQGKLTVRLQGIDAPELHYQPQPMKSLGSLKGSGLVKKYRQYQAETATVRLGTYLSTLGLSPLPCQFFTEVIDAEGPGDAIDKYGRFVGNIIVGGVDINLEILRRGWAIVALYNSMQRSEMESCIAAWKAGVNAGSSIVRYLTKTIRAFDPALLYHSPATSAVSPEGTRKFIHPKLYRRQCTWWAYRKLGTFKSGFDTFLTQSEDIFFELSSIFSDGIFAAKEIPIEKFVKGGKKVMYGPDEVVFKEGASTLFAADGKPIGNNW